MDGEQDVDPDNREYGEDGGMVNVEEKRRVEKVMLRLSAKR